MKTQLIRSGALSSALLPAALQREHSSRVAGSFLLAAALALCSLNVVAEKPEGAGQAKVKVQGQGNGKGKEDKEYKGKDDRQAKSQGGSQKVGSNGGGGTQVNVSIGGYFQPQQRSAVQAYYGPVIQSGRCPPGLAKKNNGCMPPGQAKAYTLGRPLPSQVVFYEVPSSVSVQIGLPPAGHRYVRVAADILLIAVGTGMVVDAIEDLGRL